MECIEIDLNHVQENSKLKNIQKTKIKEYLRRILRGTKKSKKIIVKQYNPEYKKVPLYNIEIFYYFENNVYEEKELIKIFPIGYNIEDENIIKRLTELRNLIPFNLNDENELEKISIFMYGIFGHYLFRQFISEIGKRDKPLTDEDQKLEKEFRIKILFSKEFEEDIKENFEKINFNSIEMDNVPLETIFPKTLDILYDTFKSLNI